MNPTRTRRASLDGAPSQVLSPLPRGGEAGERGTINHGRFYAKEPFFLTKKRLTEAHRVEPLAPSP